MSVGGLFTPEDLAENTTLLAGLRYSAAYGWDITLDGHAVLRFYLVQGTGSTSIVAADYSADLSVLIENGTPFHWMITREGSFLRLFINGTLITWTSEDVPIAAHTRLDPMTEEDGAQFMVGDAFNGGTCWGWANDVFYCVGTALYTASFTPPFTQYTPE